MHGLVTDMAFRIRATPQKNVAWGGCGKQFGEKEVCWRTHPPVETCSSYRPRLRRDSDTRRHARRSSVPQVGSSACIIALSYAPNALADEDIHRSWRSPMSFARKLNIVPCRLIREDIDVPADQPTSKHVVVFLLIRPCGACKKH